MARAFAARYFLRAAIWPANGATTRKPWPCLPSCWSIPRHCLGCGDCVRACRHGARILESGGITYRRGACISCGACAENCYAGALELSGREWSVEQVMEELVQDKAYYVNSGGGVTLSGGEIAAQPDFARALLEALKAEGISTALETNLFAPWAVYESLLPLTDLLMFDIKLLDSRAHEKWTGVQNGQILENARRAASAGTAYLVRTPIIPGVNDTEEEIGRIAAFVGGLGGALYYELLRFNPLGESKYRALQVENSFAGARPTEMETARRLAQAAREASGLPVRVG